MTQYKSQIQNLFLSMCRKKHQPCEVVLNTGTTLRGKVKSYDQFSITLIFKDKIEVIYKSAILFITALQRKPRPVQRRPYGSGTGGGYAPRRTDESGPPRPTTPRRPTTPPGYDEPQDPPPPRKPPAKMRII
ncbi:MAG TPA: RNA chaperone Hfq [Candidatus Ozemobacteraceae bacterium]|nr:RNA chaperone Hfq [Candidatus Ozemobacteraceae bacterium]